MGESVFLKFLKVKAPEETMYWIMLFFFDSPMATHKLMEMKYFPKQNWLSWQLEQKKVQAEIYCV